MIDSGWLELTLDYRCNLRCLGCRACLGEGGSMSPQEMVKWLLWGRSKGIEGLWIGGGEPTLRDELFSLIAHARKVGYTKVLLQTNGLRLSYETYVKQLKKSGLTRVQFNIKSADPNVHDRLSGQEGAFELAVKAIENCRLNDLSIWADILLTKSTIEGLATTFDDLAQRGVEGVFLWLLSASDLNDTEVTSEIPSLTAVSRYLAEAMIVANQRGLIVHSLHTPVCTVLESIAEVVTPAVDLKLIVTNPGGHSFALEESPIEGGAYVQACSECRLRTRCSGPRPDYIQLFGKDEFHTLT